MTSVRDEIPEAQPECAYSIILLLLIINSVSALIYKHVLFILAVYIYIMCERLMIYRSRTGATKTTRTYK